MSKFARHRNKCNFIHALKKSRLSFSLFSINICFFLKSTSGTKLHSGNAEKVEGGERNLNAHTKCAAFIALFFTQLAIILQHYEDFLYLSNSTKISKQCVKYE